jgi:Xaa-Pro aminopeptidase
MVTWFIDPRRVSNEIAAALGPDVRICAPAQIEKQITLLAKAAKKSRQPVGLDCKRAPLAFKVILERTGARIKDLQDPCILPRAQKTQAEQAAIRAAHVRDGAAMVKFLHWLDTHAPNGTLTEISIGEKIEEFRSADPGYRGPSFPAIVGYESNGAIIHYRASPETSRTVKPLGLLLIDSGGQYSDGTTDITRTISIGAPTDEMRINFTHVLRGHIALARARFPEGTVGAQIDTLARQPLWNAGLDYPHGTGHGVGCYLSVHEEAASISPRGQDPLKPGMLLSNEPGYYKEGAYGIRIESLVLVKQEESMLCFETVTLAPIDRRLIVTEMLLKDERGWIDAYHARVYDTLEKSLDAQTRVWLKAQTAPL